MSMSGPKPSSSQKQKHDDEALELTGGVRNENIQVAGDNVETKLQEKANPEDDAVVPQSDDATRKRKIDSQEGDNFKGEKTNGCKTIKYDNNAPCSATFPQQSQPYISEELVEVQIRDEDVGVGQGSSEGHIYEDTNVRGEGTKSESEFQYEIPQKIPGGSVVHTPIKMTTNHMRIKFQPLKIHRYEVTFKPNTPRKFLPSIFSLAVKKLFFIQNSIFDKDKTAYTLKRLTGIPDSGIISTEVTFVDDLHHRVLYYDVTFKLDGDVDLSTLITYIETGGISISPPADQIKLLEVILQQGKINSYVKLGHRFLNRPSEPIKLGKGLEIWTGFSQSIKLSSQALLNVDVAHKAFFNNQMLIDAYKKDFKLSTKKRIEEQNTRSVDDFLKFVEGLKVIAFQGGDIANGRLREYFVNDVVGPPNEVTFTFHKGRTDESECTVLEYFQAKGCQLRYPNLNCVWVGPLDKQIFYPMELLRIGDRQVGKYNLSQTQLAKMQKHTAMTSSDRKMKIENIIAEMQYHKNSYYRKFGVNLSPKLIKVTAKFIKPPKMYVVEGHPVEPQHGRWKFNQVLQPQPLNSWGVLTIKTIVTNFNDLIEAVIRIGNDMGMQAERPKLVSHCVDIYDLVPFLQDMKAHGITLLLVILATRSRQYYQKIKYEAERVIGILTQCFDETSATSFENESISKLILKMNSKMSGINHALDVNSVPVCLRQGNVLLLGADIYHNPNKESEPCFAAMASAIDDKFLKYHMTLSAQHPGDEVILDFEGMMVEHLNKYQVKNGKLPDRIYLFRDCVNDDACVKTMRTEVQAVYKAYSRIVGHASTKKPELLLIISRNRHCTRFFNEDSIEILEPGIVVDTDIVHPKEMEFFLMSDGSKDDTARPTWYQGLCNDSRIPQDDVEELVYYLCYLHNRYSRAMSHPAPVCHAHHAVRRARTLTFEDSFNLDDLKNSPQRLLEVENIFNEPITPNN